MIAEIPHPYGVRNSAGKEAGAPTQRQRRVPHAGPGFGPLVASRPAS